MNWHSHPQRGVSYATAQTVHHRTSQSHFERVPANEILAGENGERYDYIAASRGKDYAFAYTCNGRNISINTDMLYWKEYKASWFDPRNGSLIPIGTFRAGGTETFDPPGESAPGDDWVLVLDRKTE